MSVKSLVRIKNHPVFAYGFVLMAISAITVVQLMSATTQVTKGYVLKQLKEENQRLLVEYEQAEMKVSRARAVSALRESGQLDYMVVPGDVAFVNVDTAIASK